MYLRRAVAALILFVAALASLVEPALADVHEAAARAHRGETSLCGVEAGHSGRGGPAAPDHSQGPAHQHGAAADHCAHQHGGPPASPLAVLTLTVAHMDAYAEPCAYSERVSASFFRPPRA